LPDLAFTTILLSNVVLLGGTIRARSLPALETVPADDATVVIEATQEL
jgi:hypothetical protein